MLLAGMTKFQENCMIKRSIAFFLLLLPLKIFSQTLYLPDQLVLNPDNPANYFPPDIQTHFLITKDSPSGSCAVTENYLRTLFIYRNAVDNKIVASYRPANDHDTCWVDLISYSDQFIPDMQAGGWKPPTAGANTWCISTSEKCAILHSF